jgi:acetyltransferase-like isoleucine patch superfamily enzyme
MALSNGFLLKLRRAETPFYRFLKGAVQRFRSASLPVPRLLQPGFRLLYELHFVLLVAFRWGWNFFYCQPVFRARCARVGKNFRMERLPFVDGPVEIHIGDHVTFNGRVDILSGRVLDRPRLTLADRCILGHNVAISVNREVVLEEGVWVATGCWIADSDGHPKETDLRQKLLPPAPEDIRPVRIGRYAWVGRGSCVLKGVTIGEGAVIGANSVVISNIPPYCVALGNPAEVLFRDVGRPRAAEGPSGPAR